MPTTNDEPAVEAAAFHAGHIHLGADHDDGGFGSFASAALTSGRDAMEGFSYFARRATKTLDALVRPAADGDVAELEGVFALLGSAALLGLLGGDLFAGLGEVAVAVAVDVEGVAVLDEPDAVLALGAEDEEAVARGLGRVGGFFLEGAINLERVGRGGER